MFFLIVMTLGAFCELLDLTWHTDVNATQNRLFGEVQRDDCRFSCSATFIDQIYILNFVFALVNL
jgi:hypothetical protein